MNLIDNNKIAKFELGKLEIGRGNIAKSKTYFDSLDYTINRNVAFESLIIIELKDKNYRRVVELVKLALAEGIDIDKTIIMTICKELNIFFEGVDYDSIKADYTFNQSVDYDEYIAVDYIVNSYGDFSTNGSFNANIDIYKLFTSIKELLTEENLVNNYDGCTDTYIIDYPNVGSQGQNYLKVITLPNTKDILTMLPVFSLEKESYYKKDSQALLLGK